MEVEVLVEVVDIKGWCWWCCFHMSADQCILADVQDLRLETAVKGNLQSDLVVGWMKKCLILSAITFNQGRNILIGVDHNPGIVHGNHCGLEISRVCGYLPLERDGIGPPPLSFQMVGIKNQPKKVLGECFFPLESQYVNISPWRKIFLGNFF